MKENLGEVKAKEELVVAPTVKEQIGGGPRIPGISIAKQEVQKSRNSQPNFEKKAKQQKGSKDNRRNTMIRKKTSISFGNSPDTR